MPTPHQGHAALVHALDGRGLLSPQWRAVWRRTPRAAYLPERVWRQDPDRCRPVTTETERSRLLASDVPIITQIDDGAEGGPAVATASNSMPSMVATMLGLLDVHDGQKVLEIGTATGYVAALLSARLGEEHVTSVEIDPALSEQARRFLTAGGHHPRLVVADGAAGWPGGAPYDRVIATCALRQVPYALVRQCRYGGVLVAPLVREVWSGALVRLTAREDGTASGPFAGGASYMPMRSHRAGAAAPVDASSPRSRWAEVAPTHLTRLGFALYAGARLPGLSMVEGSGEAGVRLWVADGSGSAAVADADGSVTVYGPRDVWKDVEAVWAEYERLGRPSDRDMGLTVAPCGQRVWVRSAEHEVSAAW